MMLRPT